MAKSSTATACFCANRTLPFIRATSRSPSASASTTRATPHIGRCAFSSTAADMSRHIAMRVDHYRAPDARAEFRQKIERSEFLSIVFPVTQEDAFFRELQAIAKEHFDATHHCWAFRLFLDDRSRSSDAGE